MSERDATPTQTPIAIVGMACMFPNAQGLKQYWRLLRRTEDAIRDVPDTHWSLKDYYDADRARPDHTYCRRGGFLEPVKFDPVSFGIPPTVLEATDTAQLLSLMVARNALDDAGYGQSREFERERAGVILGVTGTQELVIPLGARLGHPHWRRAMIEAGVAPDVAEDAVRRMGDTYVEWQENSFPGLLGNVVAGRVANRLNLRGTNCVVDAACASSLSALHLAALELHAGRADMIVSGGVDALNDIFMFMCFSRTQALSEAGDARPFDANADGTVIGEGVGMLVLKRLADAQRDGDRVHAILRGVGAASDGRSQSIYAPLASGQALALRDAYRVSGVEPASIELVEAHGTGTKVGDAVEFEGLRAVYDDARDARQWCAVGSVKSQIGHTKAAAGAASLIKAVLALKQRVIPATAKVAEPHPKLDLAESPFFLPTKSRPWFADADHPRRAGVSSFGFGGSNFHAVLEETPTSEREAAWDGSVELIAISARNESELRGQLSEWRAFADSAADASDHARRAHASRDAFDNQSPLRLVIVAPRDVSLVDLIAEASNAIGTNGLVAEWHTPHVFFGGPQPAGDLALLFPGQGSQYVEMGRDLACVFPEAHDAIADASTAFNSAIDQRLSDYIFPTPTFDSDTRAAQERALTGTHVAQPAIGAVSVAMQNTLARFGVQPDCVAGHSFGELTALHAAGVIDEATLAGLAAERGAAMHAADDGAGAMLAVHAPVDEIEAALSAPDAPSDITLASRNAPRQAILSGPRTAIETAAAWLKNARGWPSTLLKVSAAFHTAVLEPAQRRFRAALDAVRVEAPRIPVFSNVTAGRYPLDPHAIRDLLARQLTRPVHFMDEIRRLYDAGVRTFVEVGPKNVLTNFVTQTLADLPHRAIALDGSCGQKCGVVDLARVLALLVVVGHAVDLHAWEGPPPPEMNYKMSVELIGANYRAPKKTETGERRGAVAPAPIGATQMNQKTNVSKSERAASRGANGTHTPAPPGDVADRNLTTRQGVLEGGPTPPVQANATIEEGLRALMALQQQTATAHQSFLNGQARLADTMRTLLGLPTTYGVSPTAPAPQTPALVQTPTFVAPAPTAMPEEIRAVPAAPTPASPAITPPTAVPIASAAPDPATAAPTSGAFLLEIVAELTGYPLEAINLEMDLEADLGIDSIKRLEILSAAQRRASGLKQVDSAELGSLRTLRDIADRLQHVTRPSNTTTSAGRDAVSASAEPTAPAADSSAIADALVSVVAELTGYPSEAINLDMDLEADLGIDSIKRLEILSAMQKRDPALTAVESERLGALRTLRDILGEMGAGEPRSAPAACRADTSANGKCAAPGADADCESVLLEVVAELTGYPREAIRPDMDLESDLGIDSIKRLEILSATQRRLPGLAAVDAQELGALRTLADIVRQMGGVVETVSATSQPTLAQVGAWTRPQRRVPRVKPIDLTSSRDVRGVWLVIGDSDALGRAITSALANAGCDARLVGLADRADALANLDGAILIAPTGETSAEAAGVAARNAFSWAKRLASAMGDTAHATFACVSRLGGGFGIDGRADQTLGAAFPALAKTASREWRARCVAIDITDGGNTNGKAARRAVDVANRVMEVLGSAVEGEVGLTDSGPAAVELVDSALPDSNIALSANDVVVVSGGARGVTAASVVALAEAARCKFVLLGRSPLADSEPAWLAELNGEADIKRALFERLSNGAPATPAEVQRRFRATMAEREIRGTLARIHAAGGEAVYLAVDTRDAGAVTTALSAARSRFGPITALVHGAGVIEDARIADKSPDSFDRVFATKALGAESLLAATRDDPLRFLAFFSSVSARFGNAGQVDYAMANEYLNKLARAEKSRRPSARVVSINWGPWDGGMVDAALRGHFTRQGVELISLAGGAAAFVDELSALTDDVEVVIGAGFAPELPGEPGPTRQSIQTSVKVAQPAADMSLVFSRAVSLATDRYLSDHRIDGVPMMPVAMSVEWLAHAALLHGAGLRLCALARLRVHRGFDGRGAAELRVNASRLERVDRAFQTRLELRDADNHLCVSAIADMRDAIAEAPLAPGPLVGGAYPRSIADAYRDVLFHGPRFQAIAHLRAFSEDGIAADLRTIPAPANWLESPPRAAWVTCPFALDAALQLGLLWSHERQGAIGLPTGFGAYQQFVPAFPSRDVSIELRVRHADHISLNADIDILDGDGAVIARLSEVTWIVDRHGRAVVARQTASA